jgi:hypothetical protein
MKLQDYRCSLNICIITPALDKSLQKPFLVYLLADSLHLLVVRVSWVRIIIF